MIDTVGPNEIAERLGVRANTVATWRARHASFPAPYAVVSRVPLWQWRIVRQWATATDRLTDTVSSIPAREVARLRREILAAIDEALSTDDVDTVLGAGALRRPPTRDRVRHIDGRLRSSDGRGNGRGEWDTWFALSQAERDRIAREPAWIDPHGLAPDQLAQVLGHEDVEECLADYIRATCLVGMARALRAYRVPRADSYGYQGPDDLFPAVSDAYGSLARIFSTDAALYLAERARAEAEDDGRRELVCCYGPAVTELEYEEWRDEVETLELAAAGIDQAAEWLSTEDRRILARRLELIPDEVRDTLADDAPLVDVYIATYAVYLAHELV